MENKTTVAEVNLPIEKLPHLKFTKDSIDTANRLIDLLKNRKEIILSNKDLLTDYEKNERAIQLIKTDLELSKLHTSIIQKEMHIKDYTGGMLNILKEIDEKWDSLMEKAEKKAKHDEDIAKVLKLSDAKKFDEDWEFKVNFYVNVRTLIYPKIDPSKNLSVVK